ncbi:hypothetical protein COY06_02520 [Candidatus Peregrinibacteria bacterium CG_4_10_14_0_2_um_filter_41_8]|nr:MAG: hypothetical protein COY06_02520 [Candidatus Peregrinibacteria bacterium CG_4_10_14_0_2_um_filter_41_8]
MLARFVKFIKCILGELQIFRWCIRGKQHFAAAGSYHGQITKSRYIKEIPTVYQLIGFVGILAGIIILIKKPRYSA